MWSKLWKIAKPILLVAAGAILEIARAALMAVQ